MGVGERRRSPSPRSGWLDVAGFPIPADGTEHHIRLNIGRGAALRMIRRPVSAPATEGQIAFLDGVNEAGSHRRGVGVWIDGDWRANEKGAPLPFKPLCWLVCGGDD